MSVIKTGTTSTTGYIVESDTNGNLVIQTGSTPTTALTLNSNQTATFAQSVNIPNTFGFKNRIINGGMVIDQRNAGASVTVGAGAYPVDRWFAVEDTDGALSAEQVEDAPASLYQSTKITVTTADASLGASQNSQFRQAIEGYNISDLNWGTANAASVTVSFWVKSSLTGTFGGSLRNATPDRSYIFQYTINAANTWEYKTVTISGDASGTWGAGNGVGIYVTFDLGSGTDRNGTVNQWQSGSLFRASGNVSLISTLNATWFVTGVQLEKGSTATSFDFRPYGTELQLCQRYYEKSFDQNTAPANGASATALLTEAGVTRGYSSGSTTLDGFVVQYKVTKRATPTITAFGNSSGQWLLTGNTNAGRTITAEGDSSFSVYQTQTGAVVGMRGHWAASAEL